MDLARRINKIAVLVGVCPGFVGNRMLFARQIQANKLVYQGVMPWDVDAALNAFGFRTCPSCTRSTQAPAERLTV